MKSFGKALGVPLGTSWGGLGDAWGGLGAALGSYGNALEGHGDASGALLGRALENDGKTTWRDLQESTCVARALRLTFF